MTLKEAKNKVKKEIALCKYSDDYSIWKIGSVFYLKEYCKNGRKKEHYGHTFIIDFKNKELQPLTYN